MKVLYIQHVGIMGGSGRSLFELIKSFPKDAIKPHVICPRGVLSDVFRSRKIPLINVLGLTNFNNNNYGYYYSWRWLILFREMVHLFPSFIAVLLARLKWGKVDVVHINEITMPLVVILVKIIFWKVPIVVHARATQRNVKNIRSYILFKIESALVNRVISINETVASSFPYTRRRDVVHNGMIPPNIKKRSSIKGKTFTIGMVGHLNKSKGCEDFIEAARICTQLGFKFKFFLIGGGSRKARRYYDFLLDKLKLNENLEKELVEKVKNYKLENVVCFIPFQRKLDLIYSKLDLVCFPSLDPAPGRPIFEAGFYSIPSIACISDPKCDTFIPGVTGLNNKPSDPKGIAKNIIYLNDNRKIMSKMGNEAKKLSASNFNAISNGKKIIKIYQDELRCL